MAQDKVDVTSLLRELHSSYKCKNDRCEERVPAVDQYAYTETRNSLSSEDVSKLLSLVGGTR